MRNAKLKVGDVLVLKHELPKGGHGRAVVRSVLTYGPARIGIEYINADTGVPTGRIFWFPMTSIKRVFDREEESNG